jgi:hypothetical protein
LRAVWGGCRGRGRGRKIRAKRSATGSMGASARRAASSSAPRHIYVEHATTAIATTRSACTQRCACLVWWWDCGHLYALDTRSKPRRCLHSSSLERRPGPEAFFLPCPTSLTVHTSSPTSTGKRSSSRESSSSSRRSGRSRGTFYSLAVRRAARGRGRGARQAHRRRRQQGRQAGASSLAPW